MDAGSAITAGVATIALVRAFWRESDYDRDKRIVELIRLAVGEDIALLKHDVQELKHDVQELTRKLGINRGE